MRQGEGDGPSRRRHTASEDLPLRGRSLPSSPRLAKPSNYRCFCYYRFLYYELLFTEGRGPFLQFRSGSRNSPGARATQPPPSGRARAGPEGVPAPRASGESGVRLRALMASTVMSLLP